MVNSKQLNRMIERKTRSQADIARECGISEAYLSMLKYGRRKLNPDNKKHVRIIDKLKSIGTL